MRLPVSLGLLCLPLAVSQAVADTAPHVLDKISISAARAGGAVGETPQRVTVITREQLEQELAVSSDTSQILGNLIPSFSPSRQKLTNAGETFRGRNPLFMIDGVPQSNPLRDGSRDGLTIDLAMVERIEIIHGASAEHGLGATGGIINFVTRRPDSPQLGQHLGMRVTAPMDYEEEGFGYKLDYRLAGTRDKWEFLLSGAYEDRGLYYDAKGRSIGVDNTQGDTMDSRSTDVFLKIGYWLTDMQHLQFSINRFKLKGDNGYVLVPGDRATETPAQSRRGRAVGEAPHNEVLTTNLTYRHDDWLGNTLQAQLYTQRFRALYGASDSPTFQGPGLPTPFFDQSQNESDKVGGKITVTRDGLFNDRLKLTGGTDVLEDKTSQILARTHRTWVPESRYQNLAPFLQAELRTTERLTLFSGVRYEYAKLKVDDFRTLPAYGAREVEGGSPSFDETLFNAGLTYQLTDWAQFFASYSEGFGMPDVGRVLRGISDDNQRVDDFIKLKPIVTDNQEIGWRIHRGGWDAEISYFRSDSDFGSRLVPNPATGTYEVSREKIEIEGVELDTNYQLSRRHRIGASYAHINGKTDEGRGGRVDTRLGGRDVSPDRLTLRWQARWTDRINTQLSGSHLFSRNFPGEGRNNDFDGYSLVDASLIYRLKEGRITVGIENLFNEDYFTYFAQTSTLDDDQYVTGRGRTLSLGYNLDF